MTNSLTSGCYWTVITFLDRTDESEIAATVAWSSASCGRRQENQQVTHDEAHLCLVTNNLLMCVCCVLSEKKPVTVEIERDLNSKEPCVIDVCVRLSARPKNKERNHAEK